MSRQLFVKEGKDVAIDVNHMVTLNLFTTITNANFDEVSIRTRVTETLKKTAELACTAAGCIRAF